jgi:hypothetical protein
MRKFLVVAGLVTVVGCRTTTPATDVQVVDDAGTKKYVGGAAGPGINQQIACNTAVNRALNAIALRFAQDNDSIADAVAKEVGTSDGHVFLQKFASAKLQEASVQDVSFDPAQHLCMASVRWTPPTFVKDAVSEYAVQLKQQEEHPNQPAQAQPQAAPTTATGAPPPSTTSSNGEPVVGGSSSSGSPVAPTAPACPKERDRLRKADDALQAAQDELDECMRRTNNNTTTCTRYKLYVDQAKAKDDSAKASVDRCTAR